VLAQAWKGAAEARRLALSVAYGRAAMRGRVAGHEARLYDLGPEVPPDDPDGRQPAVVTWHDGELHYLLASATLSSHVLQRIGTSMYDSGRSGHAPPRPTPR
jgi:hypothetical protein